MIEAPYHETVGDLEATGKRLCQFLDVPWDERCFDFHQSERAIQTPSRWQVRKPVYNTSLERWRCFETHLAPLLKSLYK